MPTLDQFANKLRDPESRTSLMGLDRSTFYRKLNSVSRLGVNRLREVCPPGLMRRLHTNPLIPSSRFAVTPDIYSIFEGNVPEVYQRFIRDLYDQLSSSLPVSEPTAHQTIGGKAIAGDWGKLFSVPGWPSSNPPYPMGDNSARIKRHPNPTDLEVISIMGEIARSCMDPDTVPFVSKKSSGGMPGTLDGVTRKILMIDDIYRHADSILSQFVSDPIATIRDTNFCPITTNAIRQQPDSIDPVTKATKKRMARSPDHNFSCSDSPEEEMDKSIPGVDGFYAMRNRTAYGVSVSVNAGLIPVGQKTQEGLYKSFPTTFNSDPNKTVLFHYSDTEQRYLASGDASEYDSTQSMTSIVTLVDSWSEGTWSPIEIIMRMACRTQIVNKKMANHGILLFGDISDPMEYALKSGNPSGQALNVAQNKLLGISDIFCSLMRCDSPLAKRWSTVSRSEKRKILESFLRHELDFRATTSGDDFIVSSSSREMRDKFMKEHTEGSLYKVELSLQPAYHGGLFYYDENSGYKSIPDIRSYIINFYIPERPVVQPVIGFKPNFRAYPAFGYSERMTHFSAAPAFEEVRHIEDEVVTRHYGRTTTEAFSEWLKLEKSNMVLLGTDFIFDELNQASREVLADPSKLHYKFQAHEIDPRVLDQLRTTVSDALNSEINTRLGL